MRQRAKAPWGAVASANIVAFNGMKFTPEISASDVGPILAFVPSRYEVFGPGVYSVQVLTAEGASNSVSVSIAQ